MSFFSFGGSPSKVERSSFFSSMGDNTEDVKTGSTKSFFSSMMNNEDVKTGSTKSFFDWDNKDDSMYTPSVKKFKVDQVSPRKKPFVNVQSKDNFLQARSASGSMVQVEPQETKGTRSASKDDILHTRSSSKDHLLQTPSASSGSMVEAKAKETKEARSASEDHYLQTRSASSEIEVHGKSQEVKRARSAERATSKPNEPTIGVDEVEPIGKRKKSDAEDDDDLTMILQNARASLDNIFSLKFKEIKKLDEGAAELLGRSSILLNDITKHNEKLKDVQQQWASKLLFISSGIMNSLKGEK